MAGLSQGPQGHPLQVSSEMLKLSEIDPTIAPLGRIRGCKFSSLCFSKNSYHFILDLTTSSPHMQKSRRMFVFLVPLKMSSRFGFISSHQFWQILCDQFFFLNLPGLHFLVSVFLYVSPILVVNWDESFLAPVHFPSYRLASVRCGDLFFVVS